MKKYTFLSFLTAALVGTLSLPPLISKAEPVCLVSEPTIQISEFSFNSSTKDYIDLSIIDDGNSGKGTTLDDYTITSIDKTVKKMSGISVKTGDKLHFDDIGNLTATTDQLLLQKGERNLDAVCWVNDKPTTQETSDFVKLEGSGSWSSGISSCIGSPTTKNTAFKRKTEKDTNSNADWEAMIASQPAPVEVMPTILPSPIIPQAPTTPVATNEIIINEFIPDPEGSDDGNEWIELKNTSDHEVSMTGWQLDDEEGGSKPYDLKTLTIRAESFVNLKNSETGITLNNSADSMRLLSPDGKEYLKIPYAKTSTGSSWALAPDKTWKETKKLTPGEENMFEEAVAQEKATETANPVPSLDPLVEISELLPNPEGADQGKEWIELRNRTSVPIILDGWKIKNGNGKTFTMPAGSIIPGSGYLIITDQLSKLSLKNSNDEIQIIDSENQIQDNISFEDAPENSSLAKITSINFDETTQISLRNKFLQYLIPKANAATEPESLWQWTNMLTKGKANPKLIYAKGKIIREPDESGTFSIRTAKGEIRISYTDNELAKNLLKKNEEIDVKALEGDNQTYRLESFSTKNNSPQEKNITKENTITTKTIAGAIILILLAASLYLKYATKKSLTSVHDPAVSEPDGTPVRTFPKVQW